MKRIRIQKPRIRAGRSWLEVLPVDPWDPDVVRVKALAVAHRDRASGSPGREVSNDGGQPSAGFRDRLPIGSDARDRPERTLPCTTYQAMCGRWC